MNLQLCQTRPIDAKTKSIKHHKVPDLTYIAPAFHSYKEREIRKKLKKHGKKSKIKSKKSIPNHPISARGDHSTAAASFSQTQKHETSIYQRQRPHSAKTIRQQHHNMVDFSITNNRGYGNNQMNNTNSNDDININPTMRTASDATSVLRNQAMLVNVSPLKQTIPAQSVLNDKLAFEKTRRKLFRDDISDNHSSSDMDGGNQGNDDDNDDWNDNDQENIESNKEEQMKKTETLLRNKLQQLKQERMLLEQQFEEQGFGSPRLRTTTKLIDKEKERYDKINNQSEESNDSNSNKNIDTNSDESSILSFDERDDVSIASDDLAGNRIKNLKHRQENNLSTIENIYNNKEKLLSEYNIIDNKKHLKGNETPINTLHTDEVNADLDQRINYHYARYRKFQKKIDQTNGLINPNDDDNNKNNDDTFESPKQQAVPSAAVEIIKGSLDKDTKRRITIPHPFAFDERDKQEKFNHKMSIRERKLRETLEKKAQEEKEALTFTFHATPVPLSTVRNTSSNSNFRPMKKLINNYDDNNRPQSARGATNGTHTQPVRVSSNGKFSVSHQVNLDIFHYDDEDPFQAKEVPWFVKVNLYDTMMEEQTKKRKENCEKRAKKNLQKSKLPPRMEQYQDDNSKNEKIQKIRDEVYKEYTFTPKLNHSVPNFHKEHSKFQNRLASSKKTFQATKPVGFRFTKKTKNENENDDPFNILDIDIDIDSFDSKQKSNAKKNKAIASPSKKQIRKFMNKVPKYIPKSTKKFDQAIEKRIKKQRQTEIEKLIAEQARKQIERDKKLRWKGKLHGVLQDNSKQLEEKRIASQKAARAAQRQSAKTWKRTKKQFMKRVEERPLLVERDRMIAEQIKAHRKALLLVKQSLEKAGITDITDFFNDEELSQLQIAEKMQK